MNYYDVFGISPTASTDDINTAHKSLAKVYHPDINSSKDAHEKMAMLNEANEVLSDSIKREAYDRELARSRQQEQNLDLSSAQAFKSRQTGGMKNTGDRSGQAEMLRRKAEARLKTEEAARKRRTEQAQRKTGEKEQKNRQSKIEADKQYVINALSSLVTDNTIKRQKKIDVDDERYHATKVLLSMVRNDNTHLRRMAEEVERKRKIEEIVSLVNEYNEKKEWV